MKNNRLQGRVTAGRFTLPVVILICTVCWICTSFLLPDMSSAKETGYALWQSICTSCLPSWANRMISFMLYAAIGYFLIELNNTFTIIRMPRLGTDVTLLSFSYHLSGYAFAICRRCSCRGFPYLLVFPVQKLPAASSGELYIPFLRLYWCRKFIISTITLLHPSLADRSLLVSVAHNTQFLRSYHRNKPSLLVLIRACFLLRRDGVILPTIH